MNQTWKIVLAIIITIILVGGGIYYWQSSENSLKKTTSSDETASWKLHSDIGITIKYPDDETYIVNKDLDSKGFTISQEHPGNRIHIYKTDDASAISNIAETKTINGETYNVFQREEMGSGYGYIIEYNEQFYVFESVWGPENKVFELMMTTVKFD